MARKRHGPSDIEPAYVQPDQRDLLVAEMNMPIAGRHVQIGQFFYMDRAKSPDFIRAGYATSATEAQKEWLKNQPSSDRYNRRDMNAKDA
jgi:hypothetical protein